MYLPAGTATAEFACKHGSAGQWLALGTCHIISVRFLEPAPSRPTSDSTSRHISVSPSPARAPSPLAGPLHQHAIVPVGLELVRLYTARSQLESGAAALPATLPTAYATVAQWPSLRAHTAGLLLSPSPTPPLLPPPASLSLLRCGLFAGFGVKHGPPRRSARDALYVWPSLSHCRITLLACFSLPPNPLLPLPPAMRAVCLAWRQGWPPTAISP